MRIAIRALCAAALLCAASARAESHQTGGPYVPTPPAVVEAMLELAGVGRRDFVVDLGSGDGRIVLAAAKKFGARGLGVEIDPQLVAKSNEAARRLGLAERARFVVRDVLEADLSGATVVTLYLFPEMMKALQPKLLKELKPGARIVSHDFEFGGWKPDRSLVIETGEKYDLTGSVWKSNVYLWVVPAAVQGRWKGTLQTGPAPEFLLEIRQDFQFFRGELARAGRSAAIEEGQLEGARLRFSVRSEDGGRERYTATVSGARMEGELVRGAETVRWNAVRLR
jgi:hypothetical protein